LRFPKGKLFFPLASLSAASLLLSVLSGIFLSFHYFYSQPLESVLKIITFVPFGKYLRTLHYLSSQIALISLFFHLLDSLYKRFYLFKTKWGWFFLILSFFLLLFITFTGYLLRADETGELAGNIAENLVLTLPFFGETLNSIFFGVREVGLIRVYHWHLILSFILLCGIFLFHVKIKALFLPKNLPYFFSILLLPLLFEFPLRPFAGFEARGPWFFLGAQEMLKFFLPSLVFLYLLLLFPLLISFPFFPSKEKWLKRVVFFYFLIYFVFTLGFLKSYFEWD